MGFFLRGGWGGQGFIRTVGALLRNDPRHTKAGLSAMRDQFSALIKYDHVYKDACLAV